MDVLSIDTTSVQKFSKQFGKLEGEMTKATVAALNRTITHVKKEISKAVVSEYEIKPMDVKKSLDQKKASLADTTAYIKSEGKPLSLAHFKFTPKRPPKIKGVKVADRKVVTVKIKKQVGAKKINGFVQTINGATNVFKRLGKARFPIAVVRTVSVPQMIENSKVYPKIKKEAEKKLEERLTHEIDYRMNKMAQRFNR